MFTLATDVQKIIMEFLKPEEIKTLYETCEETKVMFDELTKHTNFIVDCKRIMLDQEIKWFESKKIKLKLFESYRNNNGMHVWYQNGTYHRDNDLPAVINTSGTQFWYKNGLQHREHDLPAVIYTSGTKFWYNNGKRHRDIDDLPAIIWKDGTEQWYKNGIIYVPN